MTFDAAAAVAAAMQGHRVAIAVSGGGDSMALLHLARQAGPVAAVTVDHGLRDGSATESAGVARFCESHGIPHETLHWQHGHVPGNLPAAARDARYALMAAWGLTQGIDCILLGHTADDRAETFLMRLAREAGVDGLSGMAARFTRDGMLWRRPLLDVSRAALRDVLRAAGVSWVEDPTNDDVGYDRVKARHILHALEPLGITAAGLGRVTAQLDDVRVALDDAVVRAAGQVVRQEAGDLCIDWPALQTHPAEIIRRLIIASLGWMSGTPYPPRRDEVSLVVMAMESAGQKTLAGCILRRRGDILRMGRELQAVRELDTASDALWDNRWRLDGPHGAQMRIRALGAAGLAQCPDWRVIGLPRTSLMASPAIWDRTRLVAAPLAGLNNGWNAQIVADFATSLLSH